MKKKQQQQPKNIAIVVPTFETVKTETFQSIYDLEIPEGYTTKLFFVKGYTSEQARNVACDIVHKQPVVYDYIFWVDSDIVLPKNTIQLLLSCNADLASGVYCKKTDKEKITELYSLNTSTLKWDNLMLQSLPPQTIIPIVGCGFGCVLLKTDVLSKMDYQLGYYFKYIQNSQYVVSEDLYFCKEMCKLGLVQKAHTGCICAHIGNYMF